MVELLGLWLATLLGIRAVLALQTAAGLPDWVLAAVPFLFIYAPVLLCKLRKVDSYDYALSVPAFSDWRAWRRALALAGAVLGAILVPWLLGYHLYQTQVFGLAPDWGRLVLDRLVLDPAWPAMSEWLLDRPDAERWLATTHKYGLLVLYQVFFVAIPEEFFYRGYMQTRLNQVFPKPFTLFGVSFGHAIWITAILFAFGHSLVVLRWWHFAIFFPGLIFGWLRERSGGVVAGAFFHAACNVMVVTLDTAYGIIPA